MGCSEVLRPSCQKIYVVDDDWPVRHSLRVLLEAHGYDVEDYASPREFLAHVPSGDGERACLILDLYMAEMNGDEVVKALRRQGATLPVIVFTGRAQSPAGERALKAGVCVLLDKPTDEHVLLESIDAAVSGDYPVVSQLGISGGAAPRLS